MLKMLIFISIVLMMHTEQGMITKKKLVNGNIEHFLSIQVEGKEKVDYSMQKLFKDCVEKNYELLAESIKDAVGKNLFYFTKDYIDVTKKGDWKEKVKSFNEIFYQNFGQFGFRCINVIFLDENNDLFEGKEDIIYEAKDRLYNIPSLMACNDIYLRFTYVNLRLIFSYLMREFIAPEHAAIYSFIAKNMAEPMCILFKKTDKNDLEVIDLYDQFKDIVKLIFLREVSKNIILNKYFCFFDQQFLINNTQNNIFAFQSKWAVLSIRKDQCFLDVTELNRVIDGRKDVDAKEHMSEDTYDDNDKKVLIVFKNSLENGIIQNKILKIDVSGRWVSDRVKALCDQVLKGTGYLYEFINSGESSSATINKKWYCRVFVAKNKIPRLFMIICIMALLIKQYQNKILLKN